MNTEQNTEIDSLELAKDAINYTLNRIRDDENIRYHMGVFTESFERLKKAHSALNGISEEASEKSVFGRKLQLKAHAQTVAAIKDLIREYEEAPKSAPKEYLADVLAKIAKLLGF